MLVFADVDREHPSFRLPQIERELMALPLEAFGVADRSGVSREDGLKMARARLWDELRRRLIAVAEHRVKES